MNPLLSRLQPYPFERLRQLFVGIKPNPALRPISLGIGEPKHPTPEFIKEALAGALGGLASYPATAGLPQLRDTFRRWLQTRYGLMLDANSQMLPVNGSREALFAFAQTVIDPAGQPVVVCPNPFYQIYEGAALLAGAQPYFVSSDPARNFAADWDSVPAAVWARTQLLFVCSPGNPTGAVMPLAEWRKLFELSDRYGFVIASDECYSEIYFTGEPPLGGLQAAAALGRPDFRRLVSFTSLSKRSNVPGLRSGFVAGDAALLKAFLLYRTYHGSAMSTVVQAASIAAWGDEQHVVGNRELYRRKFAEVTPLLAKVMEVRLPDAGFYLWAKVSGSDTDFARDLLAQYNVTVLPGSYLAREAPAEVNAPGNPVQMNAPGNPAEVHAPGNPAKVNAPGNPGRGRIRMALVAETAECVEAAQRIVKFVQSRK